MFKVGITGGIGSGKTTVANLFAELGVPIIDTDQLAREVVMPYTPGWQAVVDHFLPVVGPSLLAPQTNYINRSILRSVIFNHPQEKQWLENLLHPLIRAAVTQQINTLTADYCLVVVPLLAENRSVYQLERVLVVDAQPELQIQRVTERDQISAAEVQAIMAHQASRQYRLEYADDIIENHHSTLYELRDKVAELHQHYLQLARAQTDPGIGKN